MTEQEIKEKYLSGEDLKRIEELTKAIHDDEIIATCMGLYNHGKSYLLNALIGDKEKQSFKTADTRETSENKKFKHNNITFVDTPGLNAKKHDDKRVMDAVKKSDINLFVHNVNTGEFTEVEINFFNNINKHWSNPQEFCQRTIFVLSRIDEVSNDEDIEKTAIRMKQQIKDIFDFDCTILPVSSKDYIDGLIDNENELIQISNISILLENIDKIKNQYSQEIKKTKKDRLINFYDSLLSNISSKLQNDKLELSKLKNEKQRKADRLSKDIKTLEETLDNMKKNK